MEHILKIKKNYYDAIILGLKKWELRVDDRGFKTGDTVKFIVMENNIPVLLSPKVFEITYIVYLMELEIVGDWCIFSIKPKKKLKKKRFHL